MDILTVAQREIKLGFRNSWTYSFLILLSVFTIALLLLQSGVASTEGYTNMTGTIMNMTLYLLPLITLLFGGVSIANEKEDGHWGLLSTYPLSTYTFLWGKFLGLSVIMVVMLSFSFGLAGLITFLFEKSITIKTLMFFWAFSSSLALVFLSISITIGALVHNRWQALIGGITIWFITIVTWPLLLVSLLSQLPYSMIKTALEVLTFLNPAEFIRVFSTMKLGAGSMFGAQYDQWITWANSAFGIPLFFGMFIIWIIGAITVGGFVWERRDKNGA